MSRLLPGDCRAVLATLPANSVHCVVTSPPYYGLRDYGVAGQIGLEASPDLYLAEMVRVFREVRRVLRPDGTCWVNMGDSYAGGGPGANSGLAAAAERCDGVRREHSGPRGKAQYRDIGTAKAKDLLMMPARLALALQADGWWLRSAIVWAKPNPMPESVTDRPTSSYEMVYLLAKSARYYYDADAVREVAEYGYSPTPQMFDGLGTATSSPTRKLGAVQQGSGGSRNLRNVWTIATSPYSEAHFATFPPALAERCIRAGTSERGCCAACGAPWGRVVERMSCGKAPSATAYVDERMMATRLSGSRQAYRAIGMEGPPGATTTGWSPSCACAAATVPCTVLDPFAGAGTTLLVADRLQRDAIGIELNPDYTRMAMQRCRDDAPLFASPPPASDDAYDRDMRDLFAEAAP